MADFKHRALQLGEARPLVYTAMSKHIFYFRMFISKFVLEQDGVPLNPFMVFDYFMFDTVERDTVRQANNVLVARSDEIWVFGPVSNGVLAEVIQAKEQQKPVRYFGVRSPAEIIEYTKDDAPMEDDVKDQRNRL